MLLLVHLKRLPLFIFLFVVIQIIISACIPKFPLRPIVTKSGLWEYFFLAADAKWYK